jgi:hypothetical protein
MHGMTAEIIHAHLNSDDARHSPLNVDAPQCGMPASNREWPDFIALDSGWFGSVRSAMGQGEE